MNYIVDIIDTQNNSIVLSLEKAERKSIVLDWKGADKKDDLIIVGSALSFTMVGMSCEDGQYYDLFTGDEIRFKVRLYTEDETTIWTGFLLPDTYSEPYNDSPILINFTASDGLGRIKGKYLPDEFYKDEFSVIQIIAKCLELTGLQLDFRFAPAIENSKQKDYNQIYIDTAIFKEKNKKQDAYKILDDLLKSMLCTLFQADNCWNIEGFNIRTRRVYNTKIYSYTGLLLDVQEITRIQKKVTPLATPLVTPQAPYGVINVTHKKELLALPETLTKEKNDGWVIPRGNSTIIYPTDWINIGGFNGMANADSGSVKLYYNINGGRIQLRSRPYIAKNKRYKITFKFKSEDVFQNDTERQTAIDNGYWKDIFYMTVKVFYKDLNGAEQVKYLYTNDPLNFFNAQQMSIEFDINRDAEKSISFISNYSGLMDIVLTSILDTTYSKIGRVIIEEALLSEIGQEEEYFTEIISPLEYTTKKEVELTYGDDSTGMSTAFRLGKLKMIGTATNINIEVKMSFSKDGFWYATLDLLGANLIKDNIDFVSTASGFLEVLEVFYNYLNSEEHAIKTNVELVAGSEITVAVYDYSTVTEDRQYWEEWTDTFSKIERKPYPEVYKSVLYELFKKPVWSVDFDLNNNIKFNDFLNWNFRGDKNFILTNCKWNIDTGYSNVRGSENFYNVDQGINLPPIVEAGSDVFFGVNDNTTTLTATAYDPDGFIVSYLWEILEGTATTTNPNDSVLEIENLSNDYYLIRVTVTDNEGATATDTLEMWKVEIVDVSVEIIKDNTYVEGGANNRELDWNLVIPQNISNSSINLKGTVTPTMTDGSRFRMYIYKNESVIFYHQENITRDFSISYSQGDVIRFETWTLKLGSQTNLEIRLEEGDFVEGVGHVNGLPIIVSNIQ
jgi:hypothetical protein